VALVHEALFFFRRIVLQELVPLLRDNGGVLVLEGALERTKNTDVQRLKSVSRIGTMYASMRSSIVHDLPEECLSPVIFFISFKSRIRRAMYSRSMVANRRVESGKRGDGSLH